MIDVNMEFLSTAGGQVDVTNVSAKRPWINEKTGESFITVFKGGDAKDVKNYVAKPIQANATLRPYEWRQLDEVLIPVSRSRLNGIQDLIDNNLVYNLGNAMGTTVLEWHDVSDALDAVMTMDGITRGENDRQEFTAHYLPIPIIHCDYEINSRVLAASRALGNPLDTSMAALAVRKVSDKLEKMLFTDETYNFGGGSIYSYTNYPNRNKYVIDVHWDHSGVTGKQILDQVREMKAASIADYHYGPWMLYIPVGYETILDLDYSDTKGANTIRERILQIAGIKGIKVVDTLTADNVVLVQMTQDVVRLVRGLGIQNVQWKTEGDFINKFKIWQIATPQLRSDSEGHCGIVHGASSFA